VTRSTVDLAQLVDAGWLSAGTRLIPRQQAARGAEAVVAQDGRLYVGDHPFDTPSAAANWVYTGKGAVNGWWFWGLAGTDRRLTDVRDDYLASLGEDDVASADNGNEGADSAERREPLASVADAPEGDS